MSVNEVDISEDMRHANVYVSHLAGDEHKDEILAALNAAAGFFRTEIAKKTDIRYMPVFHFVWDITIERGVRLNTLIDQVIHHQPED
ncbi:Ribosome-binding factor A [Dehalococcoides mccartyi]|uniref:Ribosome-binding factor A n=1 Tax=Dehalococcoides mccartyi TaxID=61435 RepID=A0A328EM98_9CHLR|nr:Ribosome-binding factor A [Dehalococcoides mccartyi]